MMLAPSFLIFTVDGLFISRDHRDLVLIMGVQGVGREGEQCFMIIRDQFWNRFRSDLFDPGVSQTACPLSFHGGSDLV